MNRKKDKSRKRKTSYVIVQCIMKPVLVHCNGCGKDIMHIDGCPDCGTTRYLTFGRNQ